MRTRQFWTDALERAVRTFAQALVAAITAGFVVTSGAQWKAALITAAVAALVSALMSVGGSAVGDPASPSFLPEATDRWEKS